jgi:hypothetical protein
MSLRTQVEINICTDIESTNDIDYLINEYMHCFYLPTLITYKLLNKTFLPKFLRSKTFSKYMNELINGSQFKIKPGKAKTCSNANGDENTSFINKTNELDLLWQRPKAQMQIGQIDPYGRYKTTLDYESYLITSANNGKRLPKKIRNLLNLNDREHEQSEEEIAFKVAEMLINDVCKNNVRNT